MKDFVRIDNDYIINLNLVESIKSCDFDGVGGSGIHIIFQSGAETRIEGVKFEDVCKELIEVVSK